MHRLVYPQSIRTGVALPYPFFRAKHFLPDRFLRQSCSAPKPSPRFPPSAFRKETNAGTMADVAPENLTVQQLKSALTEYGYEDRITAKKVKLNFTFNCSSAPHR